MKVTKLADLAASIERRKAQLGLSGYDYVQPNSGAYRTPEKRELLRAIEQSFADPSHDIPANEVFERLRRYHSRRTET